MKYNVYCDDIDYIETENLYPINITCIYSLLQHYTKVFYIDISELVTPNVYGRYINCMPICMVYKWLNYSSWQVKYLLENEYILRNIMASGIWKDIIFQNTFFQLDSI